MYRIDNIGREFTDKGRSELEAHLNQAEREGWEYHSVFSVSQSSCIGANSETYYMVLKQK